ncbi:hypothetical protein V6Z12_D11G391400 [Gossypium hirsutum]
MKLLVRLGHFTAFFSLANLKCVFFTLFPSSFVSFCFGCCREVEASFPDVCLLGLFLFVPLNYRLPVFFSWFQSTSTRSPGVLSGSDSFPGASLSASEKTLIELGASWFSVI